jgi:hypothetical protein
MAADLVSAMLLGGVRIVHLGRPSDEPEIFTAADEDVGVLQTRSYDV